MTIEMREIPIRDVFDGYADNAEEGVVAYGGRLNVRPAYQREFVYKDKQRDEVINTIKKGFPLNIMYWIKIGDDFFEILDGQQRTISICQYLAGDYSIDYQYFHNLTESEKQQILDYKLTVYICEGSDKEKLDWFKIVNIAGEKLTNQELRNAVYTGEWLADAKKYFSKIACPAYQIAGNYLNGASIRQDYLETVLRWISDKEGKVIEEYMSEHQHDTNCNEIWLYFQAVIAWVKATFPTYRKEMKGLEWGLYYNRFSNNAYNPKELENRIVELMEDEDVTKNAGIYLYLLGGDEKYLNIRTFTDKQKRMAYEKQGGICPKCLKYYEYKEMEGDHIIPWSKGGKTTDDNLQMLCKRCNGIKSNI